MYSCTQWFIITGTLGFYGTALNKQTQSDMSVVNAVTFAKTHY